MLGRDETGRTAHPAVGAVAPPSRSAKSIGFVSGSPCGSAIPGADRGAFVSATLLTLAPSKSPIQEQQRHTHEPTRQQRHDTTAADLQAGQPSQVCPLADVPPPERMITADFGPAPNKQQSR